MVSATASHAHTATPTSVPAPRVKAAEALNVLIVDDDRASRELCERVPDLTDSAGIDVEVILLDVRDHRDRRR